jgi:flavodoxin
MKTAVRYYSGSGNTKALAEAIASAAGVKAVSVDSLKQPSMNRLTFSLSAALFMHMVLTAI